MTVQADPMLSATGLGPLLSAYVPTPEYLVKARRLHVALFVLALPWWFVSIRALIRGAPLYFVLGMALFGAAFAGLGELVRRQRHFAANTEIRIYEHGLTYRQPGAGGVVRWADAEWVQMGHWIGGESGWGELDARIGTAAGRVHRIRANNNQFRGLPALSDEIVVPITSMLFEPAQARYERGDWIEFGDLSVSKRSVRTESKQIDWSELERADVKDGLLVLRRKEGGMAWKVQRLSRLPNALLMILLIEDHLSEPVSLDDFADLHQPRWGATPRPISP